MAELEPLPERPAYADPSTAPVPTAPVSPSGEPSPGVALPSLEPAGASPSRPSRRGIFRWAVALIVVALVVGTVSVAASFLAASGQSSIVEGWLPKDTIFYAELRADLPGNQATELGSILQAFPGFRDQAQSGAVVDQALTELFDRANVSWTNDIKPWLGGEVGIAASGALFDADAAYQDQLRKWMNGGEQGSMPTMPAVDDGMVALISVKDATAAEAWMQKVVGTRATVTQYAGGNLWVGTSSSASLAWTVRGKVLIIGFTRSVKAAIDTGGASTLPATAEFRDARKTAPGSYLAFGYVDLKAYVAKVQQLAGSAPRSVFGTSSPACTSKLTEAMASVPAWAAGDAVASNGALVFDLAVPAAPGPASPAPSWQATNGASGAVAHLPASTVFEASVRSLGPVLVSSWQVVKGELAACYGMDAASVAQVDNALAVFGGLDSLVGWAGDTTIAVTRDGATWNGGLVATTTDDARAAAAVARIKGLLALAGSSSGVTAQDQPLGSGTMTILSTAGSTFTAAVHVGFTVQGGVFAIGSPDFVKAVVGVKSGSSLAVASGYRDAMARAGGPGVEELYVDLTSLRQGIEAAAPAGMPGDYSTSVQPFISPFDRFVAVVRRNGDGGGTGRAVLVFTH